MGRGRFVNVKLGKRTGATQRQQKRKLEAEKGKKPARVSRDHRAIINFKEKP
ncbi:MAG: hypothetical protein HY648_10950 [Acidobacteria bacterium]|nr:hypothetical protein [Acidobacteriota bacterium]